MAEEENFVSSSDDEQNVLHRKICHIPRKPSTGSIRNLPKRDDSIPAEPSFELSSTAGKFQF